MFITDSSYIFILYASLQRIACMYIYGLNKTSKFKILIYNFLLNYMVKIGALIKQSKKINFYTKLY